MFAAITGLFVSGAALWLGSFKPAGRRTFTTWLGIALGSAGLGLALGSLIAAATHTSSV
jgi:hypothetical protein